MALALFGNLRLPSTHFKAGTRLSRVAVLGDEVHRTLCQDLVDLEAEIKIGAAPLGAHR